MEESSETGVEALWLIGHEILIETAHYGPKEDLSILELEIQAPLLKDV